MAKNTQLLIRVAPEEKERFGLAAKVSGESVSVWIRQVLRAAAVASLSGLPEAEKTENSPVSIYSSSDEEAKTDMAVSAPEAATPEAGEIPEILPEEAGSVLDLPEPEEIPEL